MSERDMSHLLDRAAGSGELPPGFVERVVTRGEARARRRWAPSAAAATAAIIVAVGVGYAVRPSEPGGFPSGHGVAGTPTGDLTGDLVRRLRQSVGAEFATDRLLVVGAAGDETVAVLRRDARPDEAHVGGRAAEVWMARGPGMFHRAVDYISYDLGCTADDSMCPGMRPAGLGFAAIRRQPSGRTFVVVAATGSHEVTIRTAEGETKNVGPIPTGGIVEVATKHPWQIRLEIATAPGQAYVLPIPPGGVIEG
ncbi:hypothetical protein [Polymorphospora lycopeni]|uniref:Uncharacterized protein n=1 Tax=Polymorphospora lycopeni TaxID=3140240 RepID=A0ABV5CV95_9ACTN